MTDKTYFERRILGVTSARPTPTQLPVLEEAVPLLAAGQPVALVGPGGSGKSTVMRLILHRMRAETSAERYMIAGVTGDDIAEVSPSVFWTQLILPQLFRQLEGVDPSLAKDLMLEPDRSGNLERGLDVIFYRFSQLPDVRLVIAWDDFDWIVENKELDAPFFGFLRSLVTKGVAYLIASARPMETVLVFDATTSPFHNVFHKLRLELVER
jgi:energy-coupling factor transporter ATP-binding protein EcfA2